MKNKGFTLVELMVVVAIMTILGLLMLSALSRTSHDEIKSISDKAQVVINEAKKLKENNIDVKVKQPDTPKEETKQKAEVPKEENTILKPEPKSSDTVAPEGMKKL
jgi:prepilin-type N-terminal cleavage/methylation domain-containing protein